MRPVNYPKLKVVKGILAVIGAGVAVSYLGSKIVKKLMNG